jgi:hypothetical protein
MKEKNQRQKNDRQSHWKMAGRSSSCLCGRPAQYHQIATSDSDRFATFCSASLPDELLGWVYIKHREFTPVNFDPNTTVFRMSLEPLDQKCEMSDLNRIFVYSFLGE